MKYRTNPFRQPSITLSFDLVLNTVLGEHQASLCTLVQAARCRMLAPLEHEAGVSRYNLLP